MQIAQKSGINFRILQNSEKIEKNVSLKQVRTVSIVISGFLTLI